MTELYTMGNMIENGRLNFAGTRRHIHMYAQRYLLLIALQLGMMLVILVSAWQGWWAFVLPAMVVFIVGGYFGLLSIWAAYVQFDIRANQDHHVLFELGQVNPTDRFAHINLGSRVTAQGLSRRLTGGRISVVDVYNPQLTPRPELLRMRRQAGISPPDPRLTFLEGSIDLLPLPDKSVQAVTMSRILSEFWQHGDRLCLLQEVYRILPYGGKLLVAERVRTEANAMVMGPAVLRLHPMGYWETLLSQAGFKIINSRTTYGLVHYIRAEKPHPSTMQQLTFDFGI